MNCYVSVIGLLVGGMLECVVWLVVIGCYVWVCDFWGVIVMMFFELLVCYEMCSGSWYSYIVVWCIWKCDVLCEDDCSFGNVVLCGWLCVFFVILLWLWFGDGDGDVMFVDVVVIECIDCSFGVVWCCYFDEIEFMGFVVMKVGDYFCFFDFFLLGKEGL